MTSETYHLLPPPISITFDASNLPSCSANLMPFHIDYDGPAPVDSFLVQRSASSSGEEESFVSAFRGRAVQSTPLSLPLGFAAKVVEVSQVAGSSSGRSSEKADGEAAQRRVEEEERERESKRRRIAQQAPAKQQKFSMDSDEEEENEDEGQSPEDEYEPAPPHEEAERASAATEIVEAKQTNEGPTIHIQPIAHVTSDQLTIWGPDGPIDKGDDTFFRTIGEWYSVVAPLLHG